jgi:dynein heavy chain
MTQAVNIAKDKEDAVRDLMGAMPALQRAQVAVTSLNSKDIVELKSNRNPAVIIKYILDTVVVFFGQKLLPIIIVQVEVNKKEGRVIPYLQDSYDEGGKACLSDLNFMKNLVNFQKD